MPEANPGLPDPDGGEGDRRERRRADLLLLTLLLATGVTGLLFGGGVGGPVALVGGLAATLVQVPVVLARGRWPRAAYGAWTLMSAVALPIGAVAPPYTVGVLAFALARGPRRSAGVLWAGLGGHAVAMAVVAWRFGGIDLPTAIGGAVGATAVAGLIVLVGAVAARVSRRVRDRDLTERAAADRERLDAALEAERARIADEVSGGVLVGLRRLVGRVEAVTTDPTATSDALAALREEARGVLTGMRRVLGALRRTGYGDTDVPGTSAPAPGPSTAAGRRRPPLPTPSGLAMALGLAAVAAAFAARPKIPSGDPRVDVFYPLMDAPTGPAWAFVSLQLLCLLWWRSAPGAALAVATVASAGSGLLGGSNLFAETSWMVLVYATALGWPARRSATITVVCSVVIGVGYLLSPVWGAQLPLGVVGLMYVISSSLLVPLLWTVGAHRRRVRGAAETEQRLRADRRRAQAVEEERLRAARELHDVVAHHVSALTVQAGAASVTDDPAVLAEAMHQIAASGRRIAAALPEIGGTTPDHTGVPLTDDGLADLLAPAREAGLPVRLDTEGEPAHRTGDADLFAQRILVEALTNVVRHAGPSSTRVSLRHGADELVVSVEDGGPVGGHRRSGHGSGLGLVGMRERAELLGGSLVAGPAPDGGWSVLARLPRGRVVPAEERGSDDLVPADDAPPRRDPYRR